jgi:hypothetical protein
MRAKCSIAKKPAEQVINDIRRATRQQARSIALFDDLGFLIAAPPANPFHAVGTRAVDVWPRVLPIADAEIRSMAFWAFSISWMPRIGIRFFYR